MKKFLTVIINPYIIFATGLLLLSIAIIIRMQMNQLQLNHLYLLPLPNTAGSVQEIVFKADKANAANLALPKYQYKIQFGDNLDSIMQKLNISAQDKKKLLIADKKNKRLINLKVNDELKFWFTRHNQKVSKLEIVWSNDVKSVYERRSNSFSYKEIKLKGKWQPTVITGKVTDNFSLSAHRAGLSFAEIDEVTKILGFRVNLHRELRFGDAFTIVKTGQVINGQQTGKSEIEAIKIQTNKQFYLAYLHIDGNYYDEAGLPIARTFLRYPTKKRALVSSHFNLDRKHPISKRLMPHKGTDFYANTGTKVIATADGVVKSARYHTKAGYYLVIDHGNRYLTRYLHNSKLLVVRGEKVKLGQVIAFSGSSGKVTGPHIHYELWVRGKPINPMKAIIATHHVVPNFQRAIYNKMIETYDEIMQLGEEQNLAQSGASIHYLKPSSYVKKDLSK